MPSQGRRYVEMRFQYGKKRLHEIQGCLKEGRQGLKYHFLCCYDDSSHFIGIKWRNGGGCICDILYAHLSFNTLLVEGEVFCLILLVFLHYNFAQRMFPDAFPETMIASKICIRKVTRLPYFSMVLA
jgi:hypothetical protein